MKFIKGQIAWNKGKSVSIETRNKISKIQKGKHNSPSTEFKKGINISPDTQFKKGDNLREKHPNWKGGRRKISKGYITILSPEHPFRTKQGYVMEHRLVMEKHIGRYLTPEEIVHHKGIRYPMNSPENKGDNAIDNLELLADSKHRTIHIKDKKSFIRTGCHPKTEFKKGMIPWNKGKKYKIK